MLNSFFSYTKRIWENTEKQKRGEEGKLDFYLKKRQNILGNSESNFVDKLKQELVFCITKIIQPWA